MTYAVKEVFLTLQGEGGQSGRRAVFCRFAGCNLWTGREQDRAKAVCQFCDTDFVGGARYDLDALADLITETWGSDVRHRLVVFTGGEPLLQLDRPLLAAVRARNFATAVETNGTLPLPATVDWVTVSPKAGAPLRLTDGDELKVVWPQPGLDLDALAGLSFPRRSLQPMDNRRRKANLAACVAHCLADARWQLTIQAHKLAGLR